MIETVDVELDGDCGGRAARPGIVNINAIIGGVTAPGLVASKTNRAARLALRESLVEELAVDGILVKSVNIGYVPTPQWKNIR